MLGPHVPLQVMTAGVTALTANRRTREGLLTLDETRFAKFSSPVGQFRMEGEAMRFQVESTPMGRGETGVRG